MRGTHASLPTRSLALPDCRQGAPLCLPSCLAAWVRGWEFLRDGACWTPPARRLPIHPLTPNLLPPLSPYSLEQPGRRVREAEAVRPRPGCVPRGPHLRTRQQGGADTQRVLPHTHPAHRLSGGADTQQMPHTHSAHRFINSRKAMTCCGGITHTSCLRSPTRLLMYEGLIRLVHPMFEGPAACTPFCFPGVLHLTGP